MPPPAPMEPASPSHPAAALTQWQPKIYILNELHNFVQRCAAVAADLKRRRRNRAKEATATRREGGMGWSSICGRPGMLGTWATFETETGNWNCNLCSSHRRRHVAHFELAADLPMPLPLSRLLQLLFPLLLLLLHNLFRGHLEKVNTCRYFQ